MMLDDILIQNIDLEGHQNIENDKVVLGESLEITTAQ